MIVKMAILLHIRRSTYFDVKSALVLFNDFLLKFCTSARFFLCQVQSALGFGLLLLVADHLLNACGLQLLLLLLHVDKFSLLALFHLDSLSLLELLLEELLLSHLYGLLDVHLHIHVPLEEHPLFEFFLSAPLLLDPHLLLVPLFHTHDVLGLLFGLFDLLPCLYREKCVSYMGLPFVLPS